ncbi:MAG: PIN domain-containing protein [archaeon]|nr:PIN domain-containing protein [archaeon]
MRVFVDSSVFIYGLEFEESNSAIIYNEIVNGTVKAVINEKVIEEVVRYFSRRKGRHFAYLIESQLRRICEVKQRKDYADEIEKWRGKIKEKDSEHLAIAKKFELKIVAYDADFMPFEEYYTPKQFVEGLGKRPYDVEW